RHQDDCASTAARITRGEKILDGEGTRRSAGREAGIFVELAARPFGDERVDDWPAIAALAAAHAGAGAALHVAGRRIPLGEGALDGADGHLFAATEDAVAIGKLEEITRRREELPERRLEAAMAGKRSVCVGELVRSTLVAEVGRRGASGYPPL